MTDRTPESVAATPSGPLARLHQARLERWHQQGEALLTFENVRSWLNAAGLVLFAPRPQIPAPGPTFVEAVLGRPAAEPTLQETEEARSLLARLVAEGIAVPLNLLGTTSGAVGETPDYVVSAGVFSYVFTLRGDKAWKQPPTASGTTKVSQLAAHTYEILAKSGPRSASDLTAELGNAVTESAVLRALGELWAHLRVLPLGQSDGRPTLWELIPTRFTKQIKAGANAGQPSALSALSSLYLSQVLVATEEEIEVFLSPLAPRSRTRDVLHALTGARQLETIALEGRTMLHVAGEPPAFLNPEAAPGERIAVLPVAAESGEEGAARAEATDGERIKKYVPKPRKLGTGPLAKGAPVKRASRPAERGERKNFADRGERKSFAGSGERKSFAERGERKSFAGSGDRERRPFTRSRPDAAAGGDRPRFDRPWDEGRPKPKPRGERPERRSFAASGEGAAEARRPRSAGPGEKRADRGSGGWKPAFRENNRPFRQQFREETGRSREEGSRPPRRETSESAGLPRSREKRPFAGPPRRREGGDRAAAFGQRPAGPRPTRRTGAEDRPQGDRPARPFRRFDAPRGGENRPPRAPREGGANDARPPRSFRPRPEGGREGSGRERRPAKFAARRTGGDFAARPRRREGDAGRPAPKKGASGSRGPKRTFRRKEDESA